MLWKNKGVLGTLNNIFEIIILYKLEKVRKK